MDSYLVSLDRFEGELAVLVTVDREVWHVPAGCLPEGVREGDVMRVSFERDEEETARLRDSIGDLQRRLLERTEERRRGDG